MSEIARFYGFTVSMDNSFKGTPGIVIDYKEDHLKGYYDIQNDVFTNDNFPQNMKRVIIEWLEDHIQTLRAMWNEKTIVQLPDWE